MGSDISAKMQTLDLEEGCKYNGEVLGGKPHGNGCMECQDGRAYQGEWSNGNMHGKGRFLSERADYAGDFADGLVSGNGALIFWKDSFDSLANAYFAGRNSAAKAFPMEEILREHRCYSVGSFRLGRREGPGTETCIDAEEYISDDDLIRRHQTKDLEMLFFFDGKFRDN